MTISKQITDKFNREASLAVADPSEAKRYVTSAAKFSQAAGEAESFVGVVAAYATHAAIRTGFLGGSEADSLTQDQYADQFGRSKSAVTLWKRLAVAFVDLGIDPDSDLGRVLRSGANKAPIAKAIMAEGTSEAAVREAAATVYQTDSDGNLTGTLVKATREPGEAGGAGTMPEVPRNDDTRVAMMEACLAALSSGDLSPGIAKRLGEFRDALDSVLETRKVAQTA